MRALILLALVGCGGNPECDPHRICGGAARVLEFHLCPADSAADAGTACPLAVTCDTSCSLSANELGAVTFYETGDTVRCRGLATTWRAAQDKCAKEH